MREVKDLESENGNNNSMIDIYKLQEIAKKYGFRDVLSFSEWVENNDLGEILFGRYQEDIENNKEEIDKDSLKYKSTILALEILSLPEAKNANLDNVTFDQWLKWSRKVRKNRFLKKTHKYG